MAFTGEDSEDSRGGELADEAERAWRGIDGAFLELRFARRMPNWLRQFVRRPVAVLADDLPEVERGLASGLVSAADVCYLADCDAVARGLHPTDGRDLIVVVELSCEIQVSDVERAEKAADILRRVGLRSQAVVIGYAFTASAEFEMNQRNVLCAIPQRAA